MLELKSEMSKLLMIIILFVLRIFNQPSSILILLSSTLSLSLSVSGCSVKGFEICFGVGLDGENSSSTAVSWLEVIVSAFGTTEGKFKEDAWNPDGPKIKLLKIFSLNIISNII